MNQTSISHLKTHLSRELKKVKRGEEVVVMERNHPIAKIIPLSVAEKVKLSKSFLKALIEEGVLVPPRSQKRITREQIKEITVMPKKKTSLVKALLDEREEFSW